jgi:hypothetical protein
VAASRSRAGGGAPSGPASTRPRNRLREAATSTGCPSSRQTVEVGEQDQVVLGLLGEAEARVDDYAVRGDTARQNGLHACVEFVDDFGDDVVVRRP